MSFEIFVYCKSNANMIYIKTTISNSVSVADIVILSSLLVLFCFEGNECGLRETSVGVGFSWCGGKYSQALVHGST